jgi:uncharacterized membrane protein (DUF485 family)
MAESTTTVAGHHAPAGAADRSAAAVDWEAIARSPEFRHLIARRRRFVVPATIFFLAWYFGFIVLAGYAEGFMGHSLYQGFTVGYALALSQFVMTWGLAWLYLRKADREFDPLAERVTERFAPAYSVADADAPLTRQRETQAEERPAGYEQEVEVR